MHTLEYGPGRPLRCRYGTGGTFHGAGKAIKAKRPDVKIVLVRAASPNANRRAFLQLLMGEVSGSVLSFYRLSLRTQASWSRAFPRNATTTARPRRRTLPSSLTRSRAGRLISYPRCSRMLLWMSSCTSLCQSPHLTRLLRPRHSLRMRACLRASLVVPQ
jgi:hypothetical protein